MSDTSQKEETTMLSPGTNQDVAATPKKTKRGRPRKSIPQEAHEVTTRKTEMSDLSKQSSSRDMQFDADLSLNTSECIITPKQQSGEKPVGTSERKRGRPKGSGRGRGMPSHENITTHKSSIGDISNKLDKSKLPESSDLKVFQKDKDEAEDELVSGDTSTPVHRGRGRPRGRPKRTTQNSHKSLPNSPSLTFSSFNEQDQQSNDTPHDSPPQAVKRGQASLRGRGGGRAGADHTIVRKISTSPEDNEESIGADLQDAPKRGRGRPKGKRGRPRKRSPEIIKLEDSVLVEDSGMETPVRKRGRPPRICSSNMSYTCNLDHDSKELDERVDPEDLSDLEAKDQFDSEHDPDTLSETPASQPRKRGRPPKYRSKDPEITFGSEHDVDPKTPVSQPRKRGRRPKDPSSLPKKSKHPTQCPACKEEFDVHYTMTRHMLRIHFLDWSVKNPEGTRSTTKVVKILGKITCPDCKKDFRFASYFESHLKWCGREDEMSTCDQCGSTVKSMWFQIHLKSHDKKKKQEQEAAEEKDISQEKLGKRVAAQKAIEAFHDLVYLDDDDKKRKKMSKSDAKNELYEVEEGEDDSDDSGSFVDSDDDDENKQGYYTGVTRKPRVWVVSRCLDLYMADCKVLDKLQILTDMMPNLDHWRLLSGNEVADFQPLEQTSPQFKVKTEQSSDPIELKFGESHSFGDMFGSYAGGPVWGMAWCPNPVFDDTDQYLAVAIHLDPDHLTPLEGSTEGKALIQLWNYGKLPVISEDLDWLPVLEACIATDSGGIFDLKWCPHGAHTQNKRLGILAAATSSGKILLYSIPYLKHLPVDTDDGGSSPKIYRVLPDAVLCSSFSDNPGAEGACFSLAWHTSEGGATVLAAGYADGYVSIWDPAVRSPLLYIPGSPSQPNIIHPYLTFPAHLAPVTGVEFCRKLPRFLVSVSHDRMLKYWDVEDTSSPLMCHSRNKLESVLWPPYWPITFSSGDNCYSLGHNCSFSLDNSSSTRYHRPITYHRGNIWTMDHSNWMHSFVSCDSSGSVINFFLHLSHPYFLNNKDIKARRINILQTMSMPVKTINNPTLSRGSPQNNLSNVDTSSPDLADSIAFEKNQEKNTKSEKLKCREVWKQRMLEYSFSNTLQSELQENQEDITFDEVTGPTLRDLYRVCFNPNLSSYTWLSLGGQAGIILQHSLTPLLKAKGHTLHTTLPTS